MIIIIKYMISIIIYNMILFYIKNKNIKLSYNTVSFFPLSRLLAFIIKSIYLNFLTWS